MDRRETPPALSVRLDGATLVGEFHSVGDVATSSIADALRQARDDEAVRALVLSIPDGGIRDIRAPTSEGPVSSQQAWLRDLVNLEKPVIVAVQGACPGLAFDILLAADFSAASTMAAFRATSAEQGLIPDFSALHLLPRSVGRQRAKDILLSGRVVSAEEAHALGLVTTLCASDAVLSTALDLAARFHSASAMAFGATKSLLNKSLHLDQETMAELEAFAQAAAMDSEYHRDASDRFRSKQALLFAWPDDGAPRR